MNGVGLLLPFRSCGAGDAVRLGLEAEALGFSSIWAPEVSTFDAMAVAASLASSTERIGIGTAIVPLASRTPVSLAMGAASLADIAPGRVAIGVGISTRMIVENWHGGVFDHPLARVRDSLTIMNQVLAGQTADHAGAEVSCKGFKLDVLPPQRPRLLLAALGQGMRRLALELTDGVILNFLPRSKAGHILSQNPSNAKPFETECFVRVALSDADGIAERRIRREMASYLRIEQYRNWLSSFGFGDLNYRKGEDLESMARRLPPEFVDDVAVFGDADECLEKLAELQRQGITPIVVPSVSAGDLEGYRVLMKALA